MKELQRIAQRLKEDSLGGPPSLRDQERAALLYRVISCIKRQEREIEKARRALKGASRLLEVYINDGSPIEDIEDAEAVDEALRSMGKGE